MRLSVALYYYMYGTDQYGNDGLCVVQQICVEISRPCLIGDARLNMYLLCYGFSHLVKYIVQVDSLYHSR